jgi:hypothetical protein
MTILEKAHRLEIDHDYPEAIEFLESALRNDPGNPEIVTRLGFNLWIIATEGDRFGLGDLQAPCARRFMALYREFKSTMYHDADFCWVFGLAMSMFWYMLPGASKELGNELLYQAGQLDPFWKRFSSNQISQKELAERFRNRGIFASYYAVG